MLTLDHGVFPNWPDYFQITFSLTGDYQCIREGIHGHTQIERYIPIDTRHLTQIIIGYLNDTLIYLHFENPQTPGFTKQQKLEHFYRHDFDPNPGYGLPGLEFTDQNLKAINNQLKFGLKGKETQYSSQGRIIKSEILRYYDNSHATFPITIYFTKNSLWEKWKDILFASKERTGLEKKEIDLSTIFCGLKI